MAANTTNLTNLALSGTLAVTGATTITGGIAAGTITTLASTTGNITTVNATAVTATTVTVGTSGAKKTISVAATPNVQANTTCALTTGVVNAVAFNHTQTGVGASGELVIAAVTSAVQTGSYLNALVGRVTYTAPGNANGGMVAPICGELNLPGATQSGGVYTVFDAELNCPASWASAANAALPVSMMRFGVWGDSTAVTNFNTNGFLFHLDGFTDTANGVFDATNVDDPDFTHALRINIGGTPYFIGLSTAVAFNA